MPPQRGIPRHFHSHPIHSRHLSGRNIMLKRKIVPALITGFIAANPVFATAPEYPDTRHLAPAPACPEAAYVAYPEASHVAYAQGICRFETIANTTGESFDAAHADSQAAK
jgi:hypothetical protein